ncbi:MAG: branched-chain amino acid ABC transporter substrate-binding protein [Actinobacteria bacterium]|nr:branched-chain amino acid ABC transporter substrate-binding protein [Actinomycetota bacterium]
MTKSKWLSLAAMLLAMSMLAAACGGDGEGEGDGDATGGDCQWTLGTMGALTGDAATVGGPILKGVEYGVKTVNESGDIPCELVIDKQDSQGDPSQAPPLAQTLAQTEDLVAVVGPYFSGETDAVGDTFEEAGIPFFTPSATNPDLSGNGWTGFFRLVGTDAQQGEEAARYLTEVGGFQSVAVVHDNSEYGKPLADAVTAGLGDAAVANIALNPEETDHSAVISKASQANPDAVFFGGYQPEFSELIKQGVDAGLTVVYASGDGSKAPELAGDASAAGAIVFCPCDDPSVSKNPDANAFAEEFEADQGESAGTYAVEAYDGVHMVAHAIQELGFDGDTDVQEIREGISNYFHENPYEGLSKNFEFDDTGEVGTVSIFAYQVEGDGFAQLGLVSEL